MINWLRNALSSSGYLEGEEAIVEKIVRKLFWLVVIVSPPAIVITYAVRGWVPVVTMVTLPLCSLLLWLLPRIGVVPIITILLFGLGSMFMVDGITNENSLADPTLIFYIFLIMVSGLLPYRAAPMLVAAIGICFVVIVFFIHPEPASPVPISLYALSLVILFSLTSAIMRLVLDYIRTAFRQALVEKNWRQAGEERLRAILEAIPDAVIRQHRDGTYLDVKVPPELGPTVLSNASVNKKPVEIYPPNLAELHMRQVNTILSEGRLQTVETEEVIDGEQRIREARGIPFGDDEVLLFIRDITERKQTEAENIRLRAEAETRAHQFSVLQELDRSVIVSQNIEEIFDAYTLHANRLINCDSTSIVLIADDDSLKIVYAKADSKVNRGILADQPRIPRTSSSLELAMQENKLLVRDDMRDQTHSVTTKRLFGDDSRATIIIPMRVKGQAIGTWNFGSKQIGAFREVNHDTTQSMADQLAVAIENARLYDKLEQTAQENALLYRQAQQELAERIRAELALEEERASLAQRVEERTAELRAANDELARALKAKDTFLASMSHELRTPLNAILGISETLLEQAFGPLNDRQTKYINTIANSGQGLSALISDILDLAKVETGDLTLQIGRVTLEALCQSSLRIIRQKAKKKHLEVSLDIHPDCPPVINADERRMKQILTNLLSNAIKFTPTGGRIGLEVEYNPHDQETLFSVWDTGIGIPEKHLGRLFQPFVQIDGNLDKEYEGIGLGLSLVNRLTQLHQGRIEVNSEAGHGSRFTVSIPNLEPSPDENTQPSMPALSPPSPIATDRVIDDLIRQRPGPLLLLAEDNEDNINTLFSYLTAKGFRLIVARNGLEAIEEAKGNRPDAILMDLHMPGLDGLEAIRRIRNCDGLNQTPIIALTGFAMPGDRERCLDMGATDYVSKPVSLKKLVSVIEKHLSFEDGLGS